MLGLIGGTGIYTLDEREHDRLLADTPFGPITAWTGELAGQEIIFLPRHGREHDLPPHAINFRANIVGLQMLGCDRLLAFNAVGSMDPALPPGALCLPTQFLDFTCQRPRTLYDAPEHPVRHVDLTEPYCSDLRAALDRAAASLEMTLVSDLVYVCTEGPRFETPAEIRMFQLLGGHLVGMTGVPEVVFAREAGLCYASLCVVTNFAAGISPTPLTGEEVTELMSSQRGSLLRLVEAALPLITDPRGCACGMCT